MSNNQRNQARQEQMSQAQLDQLQYDQNVPQQQAQPFQNQQAQQYQNNQQQAQPYQRNQQQNPKENAVQKINSDGLNDIINSAKDGFEQIAKSVGLDIRFYEEAIYAYQLIEANHNNAKNKSYSLANAHPDTIRNALTLVANSGLTLNPLLGLAYLVPRWNSNAGRLECHLEPSYKGLRKIGVDSGAILLAIPEIVYQNDDFKWVDRLSKPIHNFDPFSNDRGDIIGGYCLAKLPAGGYICTPVNMMVINKIKALSKGGVWGAWLEPMISKSIIRQGAKDWTIASTGPMAARLSAMQNYLTKIDNEPMNDVDSDVAIVEYNDPATQAH